MKVGSPLLRASPHPPRPGPRLRSPPRPSHRPPARLSAKLARIPASAQSVSPEADGSSRRRRLPVVSPLPPELLRLPFSPASGRRKPARRWASSPASRHDQWAPAAGTPRPPPGGGGPSETSRRERPESRGRRLRLGRWPGSGAARCGSATWEPRQRRVAPLGRGECVTPSSPQPPTRAQALS